MMWWYWRSAQSAGGHHACEYEFNLGSQKQRALQRLGLDVTLGGRLNLVAKPARKCKGVGTVTVVKGQYKA